MKTSSEIREWRRAQREALLQRRAALGLEEREQSAARVAALLERHVPELNGDASIGFYWPFRSEMDFRGLAACLHAAGASLSLPVVVTKNEPVEFRHWEPGTKLARGVWGIPVPAERVLERPGVLIVPLLGFDEAGYRLGYGGGYYDRTLAAMQPRPFTVGVGFELGRLATIHPQDHDIPMDVIATEAGIFRCGPPPRGARSTDEALDEALKGTFPASDPFSLSGDPTRRINK